MSDTPDQVDKPEHNTIRIEQATEAPPRHVVSLRCHSCRQRGTFEPLGTNDLLPRNGVLLGQRRCPNPACHAHVFFVHRAGQPLLTYPHERLDFDASDVPPKIVAALEQAITCHASQCYEAAGMMVRKTMELLCRDRKAKGKTLMDRIKDLRSKVTLPPTLLDGVDHLRLLGNAAAHVDARIYGEVEKPQVDVAIEFAREVLKAVYQHKALLGRLRGLRKKRKKV